MANPLRSSVQKANTEKITNVEIRDKLRMCDDWKR
jgi:hypothetical protein